MRSFARGCLVMIAASLLLGVGLVVGYLAGTSATIREAPMPTWALPFAAGESWVAGGPHADGEDASQPFNALDFAPVGEVGKVRSIAAGEVYRVTCDNGFYLGIDHGSGWRTTYYHMVNQQDGLIGKEVPAGTYLGDVGTELPCGGRADGPHVHIAVYHGTEAIPVDGIGFGGYRPFTTGTNYAGFWLDAEGTRVLSTVHNLDCCLRATPTATPAASPAS